MHVLVEHVIEWASPLLLVDMFCVPGTEVSDGTAGRIYSCCTDVYCSNFNDWWQSVLEQVLVELHK